MDNLTHSLVALTLGRTPLGRAGRGTTAALLLASNAPDIDYLSLAHGGVLSSMKWHRGFTHGPIGIVALAVVTAAAVSFGRRMIDQRSTRSPRKAPPAADASFGMLFATALVALILHVLMDLATSYGTRVFSPFDSHWFGLDWMPIVDLWLLVILGAGLIAGTLSPESRRRTTAVALMLAVGDYALHAVEHRRALAYDTAHFARLMPGSCTPGTAPIAARSWPAARVEPSPSEPCLLEVAALPTILSPFRWRTVARLSNAYEIREIDLLESDLAAIRGPMEGESLVTIHYPNRSTPETALAAATPTAQIFLAFSRFPAARTSTDSSGIATVRWTDVRFIGGLLSLTGERRPTPFGVTVRLSRDGTILEQRAGE
jgi:membrane-bound metal-dependent hydrolase YbcI (DUF457 family)